MLKTKLIAALVGSTLLIAASTGANALPGGGAVKTLDTGTAQAQNIQVGFKKKFKHFKFHFKHPHHFHGGCYWMKKKARRTGSKYWWHRYWDCKAAFYY